jgi:dual specificity MAP kinase phosphatase
VDFSQITQSLFVGKTPATEDYQKLRDLGVKLVINMRVEKRPNPDVHNPSLPVLWLPSFDFPLIPIPLFLLERGVNAALDTIQRGGLVYVHCAGGVHRSVALATCLLIAQGVPPKEAMELIKERRPVADPEAWYIRRQILSFAERWKKKGRT